MRILLGACVVALSALTGRLMALNDHLADERSFLLKYVATEVAHQYFDSDDRRVVGNVSVEIVSDQRYRAHGQIESNGRYSNWKFEFRNDTEIAIIPLNVEIAP
jgi:hypothetical protein